MRRMGVALKISHVTDCELALVGFQGLMLTWASETRKSLIRSLKNKDFREAEICKNIAWYALVTPAPLASNTSLLTVPMWHGRAEAGALLAGPLSLCLAALGGAGMPVARACVDAMAAYTALVTVDSVG